jgi:hypothetical protein
LNPKEDKDNKTEGTENKIAPIISYCDDEFQTADFIPMDYWTHKRLPTQYGEIGTCNNPKVSFAKVAIANPEPQETHKNKIAPIIDYCDDEPLTADFIPTDYWKHKRLLPQHSRIGTRYYPKVSFANVATANPEPQEVYNNTDVETDQEDIESPDVTNNPILDTPSTYGAFQEDTQEDIESPDVTNNPQEDIESPDVTNNPTLDMQSTYGAPQEDTPRIQITTIRNQDDESELQMSTVTSQDDIQTVPEEASQMFTTPSGVL